MSREHTYLNKSIFINEYCSGMDLMMVLFPICYGSNKAIYFMKFKGLRHDLMFTNDEYIIFYQDVKYMPKLNEYELFDKKIYLTCAEFINDLIERGFYLSSEVSYPITLSDGKKDNIILLFHCDDAIT